MRNVLSAAATLLAIIGLMTPASAEVLSNVTIPVNNVTVFNPCPGAQEDVAVDGQVHAVLRLTSRDDGGVNLGITENAHGTGQGLITGAKYSVNFTQIGNVSSSFPPPFSFTVVTRMKVIGQGNVPDFLLYDTLSFFVPNLVDDPIVTPVSSRTECR